MWHKLSLAKPPKPFTKYTIRGRIATAVTIRGIEQFALRCVWHYYDPLHHSERQEFWKGFQDVLKRIPVLPVLKGSGDDKTPTALPYKCSSVMNNHKHTHPRVTRWNQSRWISSKMRISEMRDSLESEYETIRDEGLKQGLQTRWQDRDETKYLRKVS